VSRRRLPIRPIYSKKPSKRFAANLCLAAIALGLALFILVRIASATSEVPNSIRTQYSPNHQYYVRYTPFTPFGSEGRTEAFSVKTGEKIWEIQGFYLNSCISNDGQSSFRSVEGYHLEFYHDAELVVDYNLYDFVKNENHTVAWAWDFGPDPLFHFDSTIYRRRIDNSWKDSDPLWNNENREMLHDMYPEIDIPYYNIAKGKSGAVLDSLFLGFMEDAKGIYPHIFRTDGEYLTLVTCERNFLKFSLETGNIVYEEVWEEVDPGQLLDGTRIHDLDRGSEEIGWFEPLYPNEMNLTQYLYEELGLTRTVWYDDNMAEYYYISEVNLDADGKPIGCETNRYTSKWSTQDELFNPKQLGKDNVCEMISSFLMQEEFITKDIVYPRRTYLKRVEIYIR
jgi:hypothetical protein